MIHGKTPYRRSCYLSDSAPDRRAPINPSTDVQAGPGVLISVSATALVDLVVARDSGDPHAAIAR
jgi:hypothetical protein